MSKPNIKGFVEMVLVLAAFLVIVGVGVFWFYLQSQNSKKSAMPNFTRSQIQALPSSSPAANSNASLDADFEAVQLDDPTSDLKEIDQDLNNL